MRQISRELGIPKNIAHEIVKTEKLHPSHYTKVQALQDDDFSQRRNIFNWILGHIAENGKFTK